MSSPTAAASSSDPLILLDDSTPFDTTKVRLLDQVVNAMYTTQSMEQREVAHKILNSLKNNPLSWQYVGIILKNSVNNNTKYLALTILLTTIQTRWNVLPQNELSGIKSFISELTLELCRDESIMNGDRYFLNKVNECLIAIVRHEWPDRWPNFIPEICYTSRGNQSVCENNLRILNLLSEEVFDFGSDRMSSQKLNKLAGEFSTQFGEVFSLCLFIIRSYLDGKNSGSSGANTLSTGATIKNSLLVQTLSCLYHFLKWIPSPFIFETELIERLLEPEIWDNTSFKLNVLKCLAEVSSLSLNEEEQKYLPVIRSLWGALVRKCRELPKESLFYDDTTKVPQQMRLFWETFYVQLAICLTAFLKNHRTTVCETGPIEDVVFVMTLLISMSWINHDETFKILMDYWYHFGDVLLADKRSSESGEYVSNGHPLKTLENGGGRLSSRERLEIYRPTLLDLRKVLVGRMAKPSEIYIQYDAETGEVTSQHQVDTDEVSLYNRMRDIWILLCNINPVDTKDVLLFTLQAQELTVRDEPWNPTALNRLCYSVGSISGGMDEATEREFLVHVVKNLLALCEMKRGRCNKAVVASNIMYVVGQYRRFLHQHWKFHKTVVLKLFEFMFEEFPGVQKMACETFLKIAKKCRVSLAKLHPDETQPFLVTLLNEVKTQCSVLAEKHRLYFYQALGYIIYATPEHERPGYIAKLMTIPNNMWQILVNTSRERPDELFNLTEARNVATVITINHAVAKSVGSSFSHQLISIYTDIMNIYALYSSRISSILLSQNNACRINHADVKAMLLVKRETLHLFQVFILGSTSYEYGDADDCSFDPKSPDFAVDDDTCNYLRYHDPNMKPADRLAALNKNKETLMSHFVGPILEPILKDYKNSIPEARDYEVLTLVSTLVEKLDVLVASSLPQIFEYLFDCTLEMIKGDFHSYPDHRARFYEFLKQCNRHCFDGLFKLPHAQLSCYVQSLVWAFKHEHPGVAEQGLLITFEFIEKLITEKTELLPDFCRLFYFRLLQDILGVLTDTLHKSGFKYQCLIIMRLVHMLENGLVKDESIGLTKPQVINDLVNLLTSSFETVKRSQVEVFVYNLFNYSSDIGSPEGSKVFTTHIRDFIIELKEFSGKQDELYEAEKQEAIEMAKQIELNRRKQVPGMVPQYENFMFSIGDD